MKAGGRLKLAIKLNLLILIFVLAGAYGIIGYTGNMKYARTAASERIADAVQSRDPKISDAALAQVLAEQDAALAEQFGARQRRFCGIMLALCVAGGLSAVYIAADTIKSIRKSAHYAECMAEGDFLREIAPGDLGRKDEIGTLMNGMNHVRQNMKELIGEVQHQSIDLQEIVEMTERNLDGLTSEIAAVSDTTAELAAGNDQTAAAARGEKYGGARPGRCGPRRGNPQACRRDKAAGRGEQAGDRGDTGRDPRESYGGARPRKGCKSDRGSCGFHYEYFVTDQSAGAECVD